MVKREVILQKDRRKAMILSALIFVLVVLGCFFLTAFTIQDPPPGDQYVAIGMADFGDVYEAGGDNESEIPLEEVVDNTQSEATDASNSATDIATQNNSEMSVPSTPKPNPKPKPDPKPDPKPSGDLQKAIDKLLNPSPGGGKGDDDGSGDQGIENGQIGGTGVMQGGNGDVPGRSYRVKPKIQDPFSEEGTVAVDVLVNLNGDVVSAIANPRDSRTNTSNSALHRLAEKAAKTAKFNYSPNSQVEQKGTIVIRFKLN